MPSRTQKTIQSIATLTLVVLIFIAFATFATGNSGTFNVLDFGAKGDGTNADMRRRESGMWFSTRASSITATAGCAFKAAMRATLKTFCFPT